MALRYLEEKIPLLRPYTLVSTMATKDHSFPLCSQCSEHVQNKEARNSPALCDRTKMLFSTRLCWDMWIPEEFWCQRSYSTQLNKLNMKSFPFTFQDFWFVSFLMQAEALVGQLLH